MGATPRGRDTYSIHDFLIRLRFGRQPAAHERRHAHWVRVNRMELAKLACAGKLAGECEVRQVSPLRASLKDARGAAHRIGQRETLGYILRARLLAIQILSGP